MNILSFIVVILSFLVIFGCVLYMVSHYLIRKWADDKVKRHKIAIWVWRLAIVLVILFVCLLLFMNLTFVMIALANDLMKIFLLVFEGIYRSSEVYLRVDRVFFG